MYKHDSFQFIFNVNDSVFQSFPLMNPDYVLPQLSLAFLFLTLAFEDTSPSPFSVVSHTLLIHSRYLLHTFCWIDIVNKY